MSEKELIGIGVGCLIGIVVALVAGLAEIRNELRRFNDREEGTKAPLRDR